MEQKDFQQIEEMMTRVVGVFAEDVQHKLDLVVEGQQMLSERMDRLEDRLDVRIDGVERRIDGVAVDLSAHRHDTEAHHGVYRIKES